MDKRSRIQAAFSFEATDRIPRYEIFLPEYAALFRARYGLPDGYDLHSFYDRVDIGTVLSDQRGPLYGRCETVSDDGDERVVRDSWGRLLILRRSAYFEKVLDVALKDKSDLDGLAFGDPTPAEMAEMYRKWADGARGKFAPVSGVLGLFMGSYRMRGECDYLMDLAGDPGFCRELAGRLAEFIGPCGVAAAEATDTRDTAVWVYDEFASTNGPLFSPKAFETIFHPIYKRMIAGWRAAGIRNVVLHCDGNCAPFLDMLVDAGFNGLQGIAPSTGMWLPDVRRRYGRKLVLIGGMCNIHTLTRGTPAEIRRQAEELVETARGGGVILGTHSIDGDVPVENYNLYSSVLDEYDRLWRRDDWSITC